MASWNYPGGQYGQPAYGNFPMAPGALPPGMAPPPGVAAPPGVNQAPSPVSARPSGFTSNFKPPTNMPNINFNAPVLRMGMHHESSRSAAPRGGNAEPVSNRRGLGSDRGPDSHRQPPRESTMLFPPTREELARTIFVGNISDDMSDNDLERVFRTAGNLRRWTRATDAENKPCTFGFAEYEDAESLETASEIFKDLEFPVLKAKIPTKPIDTKMDEDGEKKDDSAAANLENGVGGAPPIGSGIQSTKLHVVVDEESRKYAAEWRERRGDDEATTQFRVDTGREALGSVLASLASPSIQPPPVEDTIMADAETVQDPATGEFIQINPAEPEDELAGVPAEMRETVEAEIASFRDRSIKRDLERLKQEEEIEAEYAARRKQNRARSPISAPSGPAGGSNGIPLGPRARGVDGAPSGPKSQMSKDHKDGIRFVNGNRQPSIWDYITKDDEDESDLDDLELEQRRRSRKKTQQEAAFNEALRTWTQREHSKVSAIEREARRNKDDVEGIEQRKQAMAKRLKEWDDDAAARNGELFYADNVAWLHHRNIALKRESREDHNDRRAEQAQMQREREKEERARGMADSFLNKMQVEMPAPAEPTRFKISLGTSRAKAMQAAEPRKTAFEMESWLDDEELEAGPQKKRELKTLDLPALEESARLTDEERQQILKQIAASIPADTKGLFAQEISWQHIHEEIIEDNLQPVVEKKLVEILGVQEQMLVDLVLDHLRKHGTPEDLLGELDNVLEADEAEALVKKLWRMVVFFSEREKRGL